MRIARTLSLYVMRETLVYCFLAFSLLTIILLTQNLLRRLDQFFLVGMTGADLQIVVKCILPVALSYSIPLAFLVGILLSIRRLGADGELRAMRAAGISPATFLLPNLILGLLAVFISGWLLNSVEHDARRELVQLFKTAAARGAILEPGKFRTIGSRVIFIEDRERDGTLRGVMIFDESQADQSYRVFAAEGRFHFNEILSLIELDLWNGDLHLSPIQGKPDHYERIHFDEFSTQIEVGHILGGEFGPVRPKQMNLAELNHVLDRAKSGDPLRELDQRNPIEYELEIHRRRALPLAPLLFAGVGVPIALASQNRGRSLGLLLVLAIAFGYYALAAVTQAMAHQIGLNPGLAIWIPNIVFALLGFGLIRIEQNRIPAR